MWESPFDIFSCFKCCCKFGKPFTFRVGEPRVGRASFKARAISHLLFLPLSERVGEIFNCRRFDVSSCCLIIKSFSLLSSVEKFIAELVKSTVHFTLKPISHESRSHEYDIGFSSEIYFGIRQFGNEFFF